MPNLNRAVRIHAYGGPDVVTVDNIAMPAAPSGKVVVRVHAAGVNAIDRKIRNGILKDHFKLSLPATLGAELAGEIIAGGDSTNGLAAGARVFGPLPTLGAFADYVAVDACLLARIPNGLDELVAAALPLAGLTTWQVLFEAGKLQANQTVLIQGGAGGVGGMAVQFAKRAGARVIATAAPRNLDYVASLGADRVIDYTSVDVLTDVHDIDLAGSPAARHVMVDTWD